MRKVDGNNRAGHDWFHSNLSLWRPRAGRGAALGQTSPGLEVPTSGLRSAGIVGSCSVSVSAEGGCAMAADRKSDQGSKEEIAKGMAEAGKGEVGKTGGEAARKGGRGHGADPGKISQGMSEAGSGVGSGAKGLQGGAKSRSR